MNTTNSKTAAEAEAALKAEATKAEDETALHVLQCLRETYGAPAGDIDALAIDLVEELIAGHDRSKKSYALRDQIKKAALSDINGSQAEPEGSEVVPFNTEAEAEHVHSDFGPDHMLGAEREMMREIQASPAVRDDFLSIYSMTEAKLEQRIADIAECDRLGLPDDMPLIKALHRIYVGQSQPTPTNHVKEGSNSAA